jgi:vitamin B12 transporter
MLGAAQAALLAPPAFAQSEADGDRLVVTASRAAQSTQRVGSAISVIDAEDIALQQMTSLDEALERVPGVAITRSGGFGQNTQVRMRGFTSKHVLVMVDGVKLNNPSASSSQFNIDHMLLDNVERVEVLRGPQSGLYGADAVAGVINIITRRPQGPLSGRLSAMAGTEDSHELSLGAEGGGEKFGMLGSVSYYETDGISLASRAPGNVEKDGYENLSALARAEWSPTDRFNASAWLQYIDARNDLDTGSLPTGNALGLPPFLFQDSPGYTDSQQLFGAVDASLETFDGRLTHNVQASRVDLDTLYVAPGTRQISEGVTSEAEYYARFEVTPLISILGGAEYRKEEGVFEQPDGFGFALVDDSIENTAVFSEANVGLTDSLYLSGALRYDDNERFGGETTWRTTAAYTLPSGFGVSDLETKLRASYGIGAEAPGLRQLLGSSATFQGNPDLQPESNWMFDIGVDQYLASGFAAWSLTYYNGEADDGIFNVTDPVTFISSPQNVTSPVDMQGVEADLTITPAPWLQLTAAYAWTEVALQDGGAQLFGRPKHVGSAAITVRPTNRLAVTLDGYWRSEFYSDYPSTYLMDGYGLYNLSAVYDLTDSVQVSARVGNLFDEFYEEKLGDATYGRTAQLRLTVRR